MSLVAYGSSSEDESDSETSGTIWKNSDNGHIGDDDEGDPRKIISHHSVASIALSLPKPMNNVHDNINPIFAKLPRPKNANKINIVEENDEFLQKKATALPETEMLKPLPPQTVSGRTTVKIMIPSTKDFSDVDEDLSKSTKQLRSQSKIQAVKKSGLLAVLPKAKSEQNFIKTGKQEFNANEPSTSSVASTIKTISKPLIPDTVRNRRPAINTEGSYPETLPAAAQKISAKKDCLVDCSDSEASDNEAGDFFSLNNDNTLPEVNANELSLMIAKRSAKMADATNKYFQSNVTSSTTASGAYFEQPKIEEIPHAQKRFYESQLNEGDLQALISGKSKRRRQQQPPIQIIDISESQVLPDRDEWMRTALASSTSYQPTGVLVDEEPVSGTRRKHQITYLAHKAKANEAELQAMWAANRQNRRATQSKYGF